MRSLSPEASASSRLLPRCCYSFVCPMPTRRAWRAPHEHLQPPCPTPLPPSESLSSIALFISTAVGSAHCRPLRARMSRVSRCRCRTTFQRVPHPPRRRSTHSDASQSLHFPITFSGGREHVVREEKVVGLFPTALEIYLCLSTYLEVGETRASVPSLLDSLTSGGHLP
jgi:hypothetical protein